MADMQEIIARLRAERDTGADAVPALPDTILQPTPDQSRAMTRDMLESLGHVPMDNDSTLVDVPTDLTHLTANTEAEQIAEKRKADGIQLSSEETEKLKRFLYTFSENILPGLSTINQNIDAVSGKAGEMMAEPLAAGATNLKLGMALLDWFTRLDNRGKLSSINPISDIVAPGVMTDETKKAALRAKYLPQERLRDPRIERDFGTASEMALWAIGQKVWGGINQLAAIPAEQLGSVLGTLGMDQAEAYLQDLASRDKTVAAQKKDLVMGQVPQMVAGMAPMLRYQDLFEAGFDPQHLEDIYAQMDDPGNHGTATIASIAGISALLDWYGSPTVIAGEIVPHGVTALRAADRATSLKGAERGAKITQEVAAESRQFTDAQASVKAAKTFREKAEAAYEKNPSPANLKKRNLARDAEARAADWLTNFQDPGTYEPIMVRPARRNPAYIPELTETQYGLSAGGRSTIRTKSFGELEQEMLDADARRRTLEQGAHQPVSWTYLPRMEHPNLKLRALIGPSDAEYAGDALNMLARGAEVDDVTGAAVLAPEYYVLPDVETSLVDMRKVAEANRYEKARRITDEATEGKLGAAPSANLLEQRARSSGMKFGEPGERPDVSPEGLLKQNLTITSRLLKRAKARGDAAGVEELRKQMRLLKTTRDNLKKVPDEYDHGFLPPKYKGIMEDPKRFNNWLTVAGDRVTRSLYPGGLSLHGWGTKLGQLASLGREPMRYYQTFDPAAWERIRSGVMRQDRFTRAAYNLMMRELEAGGVLEGREVFDLAKHFAPQKINKPKGEMLWDLLNSRKSDPKHLELYDAAPAEMKRAHDRLRVVFDHYADLQGISDTDRYLEGYIKHTFDPNWFSEGKRPIEFIGTPANAELFVSHLQLRTGNASESKDVVLALDLYVRAVYKKLIAEPLYDDIIKTSEEIAKRTGNTAHISFANDLVNQLKGKPSFIGAKVDEAVSATWNSGKGVKLPFSNKRILLRPGVVDRTALGVFGLIHSGLTTGPHYAILQIASGVMTTEGRLGHFDTLRGIFSMATKEGQQIARACGTYKPFIDFMEAPTIRKFTEFAQTKIGIPGLSNADAEAISRGVTMNAALKKLMKEGGFKTIKEVDEAGFLKRYMFEAVRVSEEANHLYGPLGRSPWVTRTLGSAGSTATQQLLSYIPKQTEELFSQWSRNPGYILRYLAMSGRLSRLAANLGIDMTQDVGVGYMPESWSDWTSPAVDAALDNLRLADSLDRGDPADVERYGKAIVKSLAAFIPGSQYAIAISRAATRTQEGVIRTGSGDKLMDVQKVPTENFGSQLVPTWTMQRDIRETLARRAMQAKRQEDARFGYNLQKALDHYVDALENQDETAASKLAEELSNSYNVRFSSLDPVMREIEARSISQYVRGINDNPQMRDVYWDIFRQHGLNPATEQFTPTIPQE